MEALVYGVAMVLSLNRYRKGVAAGREVYFNLGNRKSFVMRLEVSPEERIAFSSQKRDKVRLAKEVDRTGSYVKAIKNIVGRFPIRSGMTLHTSNDIQYTGNGSKRKGGAV